MSLFRWALTILTFPIGGWIAIHIVGAVTDPLKAATAGAIAGAVIGAGQAFALGRGIRWRWMTGTTAGMAAGSAATAALTGSATTVWTLALNGLVAGLAVGAAQGAAARWRWHLILIWAGTVAASWATAWVVTALVISDRVERGFIIFGLSGAALATAATALVLRRILGPLAISAVDAPRVRSGEPVEATR